MGILPAERTIVVYGNLAEASLRSGFETLYVVYAVARSMQPTAGAHGISRQELTAVLQDLAILRSARYIGTLLERGHGVFWNLGANRVWLCGTQRLAQELEARRGNAYRHFIQVRALTTRGGRRASLLAAALPEDRPISQRTIKLLSGVSDRTQRRYRQRGYFAATRQDADITEVVGLSTAIAIDRRMFARANREYGVYAVGRDARLKKRISNSYQPSGARINRGARSKKLFAARPLSIGADGTRTVPRVFFETVDQYRRFRHHKLGVEHAVGRPFNVSYVREVNGEWKGVAVSDS